MDYDPGVTDATIGKPLNKGKIHEITPEQIPASGEFLVAIKIGDLERIKEGNKGIYSANVTVKFDPMYLDVEPLANLKGKAQPRVGENKIYDDLGSYDVVKGAMGVGPSASGDNMTQSVNIMFEFGDALVEPTYKGTPAALIGAIKFKKKGDAPAGTKVLDFALKSGVYGSCSFGIAGEDKYTAAGISDMIPLFTWDATRVNLFPAAATPTAAKIKAGTDVDLSDLKVGAKISGLDALKLVISYDSGPNKEKAPTKFYYGPDGKEDAAGGADVAGLTEFGVAENVVAAMNGQYLYAYYEEAGKKFLVKSGAAIDGGKMKVKDPIESITFADIGAMTYGDSLYDKLPDTITATTTGGVVTNPVKAAVKWEYKLKTKFVDRKSVV